MNSKIITVMLAITLLIPMSTLFAQEDNETGNLSVYLDGELLNSTTHSISSLGDYTSNFTIGSSGGGGSSGGW